MLQVGRVRRYNYGTLYSYSVIRPGRDENPRVRVRPKRVIDCIRLIDWNAVRPESNRGRLGRRLTRPKSACCRRYDRRVLARGEAQRERQPACDRNEIGTEARCAGDRPMMNSHFFGETGVEPTHSDTSAEGGVRSPEYFSTPPNRESSRFASAGQLCDSAPGIGRGRISIALPSRKS